jgi:hypothetical protein
MDFGKQQLDFEEVDRRYAKLKQLRQAGDTTEEEFDEQLKQLMVQDDEGRWWAKSRKNGEWHYHDGRSWVRGTPPGYAPQPLTRADQNGAKQRRRGIGLIVGVVLPLVVGTVMFGAAAGAFMFGFDLLKSLSTASLVPKLEGKTLSEAAQLIREDYKIVVSDVTSSSEPKGTVTWSSFPSERVDPEGKKDPRVHLSVSGGQGSVEVPDVSGLSALQAGKALIDAGLEPSVDVIIDQSGNAVAATTKDLYENEKDVTDQKVSGTDEEAGSVVPAGAPIIPRM